VIHELLRSAVIGGGHEGERASLDRRHAPTLKGVGATVAVGFSTVGKKRVGVRDLKRRTDAGLVRRPCDPDGENTSGCSELELRGATLDATE
jgi:hypothetical protein